ncbi:MAG: DinB family protein [Herpetosiphonaceae bacterium]|nr:DinB family protein [Herpetosiphonaceae bacterium]
MLDFGPLRNHEVTLADMSRDLTKDDLRKLTNEMIDEMQTITAGATDADVVFVPVDPQAKDTFGKVEDADLSWTLGHVIVHATASSEESAALASMLARGIPVEGRSRAEVPWETVHTVAQLRARLAESRRMRNAFLDTWPDEPNLELTYIPFPQAGPINAAGRVILGLMHDDGHLEQLREIMRQAQAVRAVR